MTVAASKPDSFWLREAIKYGGDVNFDDHGSELKRYPRWYTRRLQGIENVKILVQADADN